MNWCGSHVDIHMALYRIAMVHVSPSPPTPRPLRGRGETTGIAEWYDALSSLRQLIGVQEIKHGLIETGGLFHIGQMRRLRENDFLSARNPLR